MFVFDSSPSRPGASDEAEQAVLGAMRDMTALALSTEEPPEGDQDVLERFVDGVLALPGADRVRRVRVRPGEPGPEAATEGAPPAEIGEEDIARVAAALEPLTRRAPDGRTLALLMPVVARSGDIDVFAVQAHADGLSELDCAAAETLRDHAELALAVRSARAQARLDPLTGCLNHGAMQTQLEDEIARAQRLSGRLACVMLDLDDFKGLNDRHGHPAGDAVLREVAAAMVSQCRQYDVCCRYGGDEFLVILPGTGIEEAVHSAQRLRGAVLDAEVHWDGKVIAVGATAGVAEWRPDEAPAALLERVDRALIDAKGSGRGGLGRA